MRSNRNISVNRPLIRSEQRNLQQATDTFNELVVLLRNHIALARWGSHICGSATCFSTSWCFTCATPPDQLHLYRFLGSALWRIQCQIDFCVMQDFWVLHRLSCLPAHDRPSLFLTCLEYPPAFCMRSQTVGPTYFAPPLVNSSASAPITSLPNPLITCEFINDFAQRLSHLDPCHGFWQREILQLEHNHCSVHREHSPHWWLISGDSYFYKETTDMKWLNLAFWCNAPYVLYW